MPEQPIKCVSTVFLPVTDQDRSLAFFRDQFGFDVHSDTDYGERIRSIEVVLCVLVSDRRLRRS